MRCMAHGHLQSSFTIVTIQNFFGNISICHCQRWRLNHLQISFICILLHEKFKCYWKCWWLNFSYSQLQILYARTRKSLKMWKSFVRWIFAWDAYAYDLAFEVSWKKANANSRVLYFVFEIQVWDLELCCCCPFDLPFKTHKIPLKSCITP